MRQPRILERTDWATWVRTAQPKRQTDAPPLRLGLGAATVKAAGLDPVTGMERYEFVASTEAVDRERDVILAAGWELDNYKLNPVILFGHDYRSFPIGRATEVGVVEGQLRIVVEFTPAEVYPAGYQAYKLVAAGFLRAVSVGFRPLEWVWNDEHGGYDFKRQELLEVSVVPVPANQEALVAAGFQPADLVAIENAQPGAPEVLDAWVKGATIDTTPHPGGPLVTAPPTGGSGTPPTVGAAPADVLYCHVEGPSSAPWATLTTTTGGGADWSTTTWYDLHGNRLDYDQDNLAQRVLQTPVQLVYTQVPPAPNPEEGNMDELLRSLLEAVEALPDKIATAVAAKLTPPPAVKEAAAPGPPATPNPDTNAADVTEGLDAEWLRATVTEALKDAKMATTGRLPD